MLLDLYKACPHPFPSHFSQALLYCLRVRINPISCKQNEGYYNNVMSLATTLLSVKILGEGSDSIVYMGSYQREEVAVKMVSYTHIIGCMFAW